MDISALEQKLLEREEQNFQTEVEKGLKIIAEAFGQYNTGGRIDVGNEKIVREQMTKWFSDMFSLPYYAGYSVSINRSCPPVPEFLKIVMLGKAIEEHLNSVEQLKQVMG